MLRRDAGLYVLHLQGTGAQMARQHGELLAREIRSGALPFMASFLLRQVGGTSEQSSGLKSRFLSAAVTLLSRLVASRAEGSLLEDLRGLAEASGLPPDTADMALAVPDLTMFMVGAADWLWRLRLSLQRAPIRGAAGFGCSGVIALPDATASGHLLQARTLDYDGLGFFDAYPTVAFCKPSGGQAYACIASAGVHSAALTGMNEAGLFLAANTAPTRDVCLGGMPVFSVNEAVVREARTLHEAVAILDRARPASGFNVMLSSGTEGDGLVAEYSHSRLGIRKPMGGCLAATNHYLHQRTARTIPNVTVVDTINTRKRYLQLRRGLAARYGSLTRSDLLGFIRSQREHPTGALRVLGDVVCNYLNISSVLVDVTDRILWVGCDSAPVALGRFVRLDLDKELASFGQPRSYAMETIPADPFRDTPEWEGLQTYIRAHRAHSYERDDSRAYSLLLQARQQLPEEPRVHLAMALVALRLDLPEEAKGHAGAYLASVPDWDARRYRAHLVRAWACQLQGLDDLARCHLDAARRQSPHLDDADWEIRHWSRKRFTQRDREHLDLELFNAKRLLF